MLTRLGIPYKWGYPFKLLISFKGKTRVLTSIHQVKKFEEELDREVVEEEVVDKGDKE